MFATLAVADACRADCCSVEAAQQRMMSGHGGDRQQDMQCKGSDQLNSIVRSLYDEERFEQARWCPTRQHFWSQAGREGLTSAADI